MCTVLAYNWDRFFINLHPKNAICRPTISPCKLAPARAPVCAVDSQVLKQAVDDDDEVDQRPRQRQRREDPQTEDEDEDVGDDSHDGTESADSQLIKKLVRYAMACDFSRTPIRRDGIKDKGVRYPVPGSRV